MEELNEAAKILKQGGIVIFPTDTAFGIGCRMDIESSVKRLFAIRRRPIIQATPVLVSSIEMAEKYLHSPLPDNVRRLMETYWPGGLTIVYPCPENKVTSLVRGDGKNLGVRIPNHKITIQLIESVGVPILGPSANFHGEKTPYSYEDLDPELLRLVDCVVSGECKTGKASTVVDCSVKPWKIIRQGAVTLNANDLV
jgi:L-threonylcarbamoyladenylate synthase